MEPQLLDLLQQPVVLLPFALLLGLVVGSFLNVVIYRLPIRMQLELETACADQKGEEASPVSNRWFGLEFLITPGSHCPNCGHRIGVLENIPVVSYMLQKGSCADCGAPISPQYPIVEIASGMLSLVVAWHFGFSWMTLWALILTWAFIAMSAIDIQIKILPDVLILPLVWLGLIINMYGGFTDIESAIIGATAGYLSLWLVFHIFLLITGKEGMGYGDFKLFALLGAWLGWQYLPQILLVSSIVGAFIGIVMILLMGRDKSIPIPFGPYLAAAGWIALLWGDEINRSYLQIAGLG